MPLWERTFNESSPVGWPIPPFCQNTFEILVLPKGHAETSLGLFLAPYTMVLRRLSQGKMLCLPRPSVPKNTFSTNTYALY